MAKLYQISKSVSAADIAAVARREDDFGFELRVGAALREVARTEHAGTYRDPVERKPRQFDFHCNIDGPKYRIALALECKNLSDRQPLVICSVPRGHDETFNEVLIAGQGGAAPSISRLTPSVFYERSRYVGKSLMLVKSIEGLPSERVGDGEIYSRWSQALASSHDLLAWAFWKGTNNAGSPWRAAVLPAVVVPDGSLWQVNYDDAGEIVGEPTSVKSSELFVNYRIDARVDYTISHLHFFTLAGLRAFLSEMIEPFSHRRGFLFDT